MRRPSRLLLLALAALLPGAAPASAQPLDALIGQPIASVAVVADGREVSEPGIAPLLDTRVGLPLDMADVRRTLRALAALERFDEITVEATRGSAGLDVRYLVTRIRRVDGVDFRGDLGVGGGRLGDALTERFGRTPSPQRAPEMTATLLETLQDAGHLDASVGHRIVDSGETSSTLVFDVEAGPRFRVGAVEVDGAHPEGEARLLQRLRLAPGREWHAADTGRRVDAELERLRDAGRYQARLSVLPARRAGESVVDLRVEVLPGPVVEIVFEGDPLPRARLEELVPIRREGSVEEDLLEDAKRRIEQALRAEGHWRANVEYRRTGDDQRLRVVFTVTRGPVYTVATVDLSGAASLPAADLEARILTRAGRPFVEATLDADVAAVEALYRSRGFADAQVSRTVTEVFGGPEGAGRRVGIGIAVAEGARVTVRAVTIRGNVALDAAAIRQVLQVTEGSGFFAPQLDADRGAVEVAYLNRGYPDAQVSVQAVPTPGERSVEVRVEIQEGRPAVVDHVIVTGNSRTSLRTIMREAQLSRGAIVGLADLEASQRRLSALGLFRRVRIDTLRDPATGMVDVVIALEENAATSVGYGAGLEGGRRLRREDDTGTAVERLEFAPRGFFEVGRRNLWGKNRSVNLFSRASLRQKPGSVEDPDPGSFGLYEYRVIASFREPRAFGMNAEASVSAVVEQAIRSSFSYRRRSTNADLTRKVGRDLTVIARYTYGYTNVFEERYSPSDKPLIDRLFPQVTLSTIAGVAAWDTRDDAIDPTRGMLVGMEADLATRALGSEVGYVKTFSQAFLYRRVPGSRMVVAGGVRLGLATGFDRPVPRVDATGAPVLDADGQPIFDTVRDLPASERFYAGGDTTVRGFTLDRLGDDATIDPGGFPTGGDALVIGNAELRFPVTRTLGGVVFLDAGNVFARVRQVDLGRVRAAAGFGVRYKSPVGPLRFDVGFKLDPKTLGTGRRERRYALHVSIGQAF